MRSNDWYMHDDDENFSETLHNRTEELYGIPDATPDTNGLIVCPVMPLRDLVVYPRMVSPVFLSQEFGVIGGRGRSTKRPNRHRAHPTGSG